jgi:hypothetical protein
MPIYYAPGERAAQIKKMLPIIPYIVAFFSLLLVGQIIVQFINIKQLNKDSGVITDIGIRIISWGHSKSSNHNYPNYGLVIRLNNYHLYNIENAAYMNKLDTVLHKGNVVTIYHPTAILKVLSAGFCHNVSQLERGKEVLYSFDVQKKDGYILMVLFAAMAGVFYWYYSFQRKYVV